MSNKAEIIIRLDAQGQREVQAALGGVRKESNQLNGSVGSLDKSVGGLDKSMVGLGIGLGVLAVGIKKLGSDVLDTGAEFQKFDAMLETATGSAKGAAEAMTLVLDIADDAPFTVSEMTNSFIKLQNLGIVPTERKLVSFGNTAAGMGKDLDQLIEAVADASVGEMERLKEFGIKASKQGDQITFTFRGVKTTVKAESEQIVGYLTKLGEVQFAGAMAKQMKTLNGANSNFADSWDYLMVSLGKTGPIEAATDSINSLGGSVRNFARSLELLQAYRDGKIGFWDFLTANPEEAKALAEHARTIDGELSKLQQTVDEMLAHKQGNLWWSSADEAGLKKAKNALKWYELSVGDIDRLKNAALHNAAQNTDPAADARANYSPDAGMVQMGIAAGNATEDDIWLKRLGLDAASIERAKTAKFELNEWFRQQDLVLDTAEMDANAAQLQQRQTFIDAEIQQEITKAERLGEIWWQSSERYIGFASQMATMGAQYALADADMRENLADRMLATTVRFLSQSLSAYLFNKAKEKVFGAAAAAGQIAAAGTVAAADMSIGAARAAAWAAYYGAHAANPIGAAIFGASAAGMAASVGAFGAAGATSVGIASAGVGANLAAAAGYAAAGIAVTAAGEAAASGIEGTLTGTGQGSYGAGSPTSPVITAPAPSLVSPAASNPPQIIQHIHIPPGVRIIDKTALDEFARELVEPLANAGIAGVRG